MKKVFLGGTCANSTWRHDLIPKLSIDYFNPVVANWTPECQRIEREMREYCDWCLYVITPRMQGVYSIAEVVEDSIKRPDKTIFCILERDGTFEFSVGEMKSLNQVGEMVVRNGAKFCKDLDEVARFLNS